MKIFSGIVTFVSVISFITPCFGAGSVSDILLEKLRNPGSQGGADAVLEFPSIMNQVLNNPFLNFLSGSAKTNMMTNLLQQFTRATQAPFINALKQFGLSEDAFTPFWISNKISLRNISLPFAQQFARLPFQKAFKLREPFEVKLVPVENIGNVSVQGSAASEIQWGVRKIGAPNVWSTTTGNGVLVANIDTGVNGQHEALKSNYAGRFYDAIKRKEVAPFDDNGHGTHTMGTIVGKTRGIGVAPGATWIACRALDAQGRGSDVTLSACAQWVLKQKPRVVSNSWGGKGGNSWFNDEIRAWSAAGIIPVFAIGNTGPACGTAESPGDQPGNFISVGATTASDAIASFSSRGPSKNGKMKPDVAAPGQSILSAWMTGNSYETISGTSMATPHVSGAVALMLSAKPSMTFAQVKSALEKTTDHPTVSSRDGRCTKSSNRASYPNNVFGYGLINVENAMGL